MKRTTKAGISMMMAASMTVASLYLAPGVTGFAAEVTPEAESVETTIDPAETTAPPPTMEMDYGWAYIQESATYNQAAPGDLIIGGVNQSARGSSVYLDNVQLRYGTDYTENMGQFVFFQSILDTLSVGEHYIRLDYTTHLTDQSTGCHLKVINSESPVSSISPSESAAPIQSIEPVETVAPTSARLSKTTFGDCAYYNKAMSCSLIIRNKFLKEETTELYIDKVKLNYGTDYVCEDQYAFLYPSELDKLENGEHRLSIEYADEEYDYAVIFSLYILDQQADESFTLHYEMSDTSYFNTTGAIYSSHDVPYVFYQFSEDAPEITEVRIGDTVLTDSDYFIRNNTILQLSSDFLKTLSPGSYEVEVVYGDKEEAVNLMILGSTQASTEPVEPTESSSSETLYPTVEPTEVPPASICPTSSNAPSDVGNQSVPSVEVTTSASSGISQTYTITRTGGEPAIDLSKVKIRYHYTKDGDTAQNFYCDSAGIQLNTAPYYVDYTAKVTGTFAEDYLELGFTQSRQLADGSLTIQVRLNQADWSTYQNFAEGKMEVYYNGTLLK